MHRHHLTGFMKFSIYRGEWGRCQKLVGYEKGWGDLRNRELAPKTVWARARSLTDHRQKDRPSYRVDLGGSLSFTFLGHIAA